MEKPIIPKKRKRFDVNSKVAIDALNAGMGSTHVNKFLMPVNVSPIGFKTFKNYEHEMGTAIEEVAKNSCQQWEKVEREMTIKNKDELSNLLKNLSSDFILPESNSTISKTAQTPLDENSAINATVADPAKEETLNSEKEYKGLACIAASYDMGYLESLEGIQYESNMSFLSATATDHKDVNLKNCIDEVIIESDDETHTSEVIVVMFDLETSGFSKYSDILQIAAWSNKSSFSVNVNPVQEVSAQASEANGLTNMEGELMLHGVRVQSIPLGLALDAFRNFLVKLNHPVVLAAHNCKFDAPILINSIKKVTMLDEFASVVVGFADTLPLIKSATGRKGKGECTLTGLASWLNIPAEGAHNAIHDVELMVQILERLGITENKIISSKTSWYDYIQKVNNSERINELMKNLEPLKNTLSIGMRKKIATANIDFDYIMKIYKKDKDIGITTLFGKDEDGVVRVTQSKKNYQ